jgi:hypothetical protein
MKLLLAGYPRPRSELGIWEMPHRHLWVERKKKKRKEKEREEHGKEQSEAILICIATSKHTEHQPAPPQ